MKKALFLLLLSPVIAFSGTSRNNGTAPKTIVNKTTAAPVAGLSGTYTIGATGANYTTITAAVNALNSQGVAGPVTFRFKDANYNNTTGETFPIVINAVSGASATNTITFKPAANVNTTITANNINGYTGVPALFILKGSDYVTFDGSNTDGGSSRNLKLVNGDNIDYIHRSVIWVASNGTNGATYNTFKYLNIRMTVKNSGSTYCAGIYAGKYDTGNSINQDPAEADNKYLTIINNDFDNVKQGVVINGSNTANLRTTYTVVKANDLGASTTETIICPATFNNVDNFTYTENFIYNLYRNTTAGALISAGIYVSGNSTNGTITRNQMKTFTKTVTESYTFGGVVLASTATSSNILVANNFIAGISGNNNGSPYLNGHGISIASGGGYKIYHNSVYMNTNQSNDNTTNGFSAALYVKGATGVDVRNNIFVNTQTNTLTRRCAILIDGAASQLSTLNYNDVYSTDKIGYAGTNASWFGNPDYQTTLSGWKTLSGKEANSISYLPAFTSATDLHITSASSNDVLKAGTYISTVNKDIDNQVRSTTTPAIGADEFGTVTFPTGSGSTGIYCSSSTTWNGTSWSNGSPAINKDVIFTGNYTVSGNTTLSACSIYVLNGATVEFTGTSTAYVDHSVNVQTNGSLTFRSGTVLFQVDTDQNSGTVTIERNSGLLKRYDYTMWSSPVVDNRTTGFQTLKQFSPATSAGRFYQYNTNSGTQGLYAKVDETTTKFSLGKGFLIRMPDTNPASGYYQGTTRITFTGSFQGTPTNGTVRVPLTYTDANHAFNAIGNPYASPISISDFLNANSDAITGTIWLWRKTNDKTQTSYSTCNLSGYIANSAPGGTDTSGNIVIQNPFAIDAKGSLNTAQGFIVKAKDASKEVIFRNDMRLQNHSNAFFRTTAADAGQVVTLSNDGVDRLWLNISNGDTDPQFSQTLIAYNPVTTTDIEEGYDSENIGTDGINLYTVHVKEGVSTNFGIQTRGSFNVEDRYYLGYNATAAGTYTIHTDDVTGVFANGQKAYLVDNVEGIVRDITTYDYTFTTEAGTFNDRFTVVYKAENASLGTSTPVADVKEVKVYNNNNEIKALAPTQIKAVVIYDMLGRTLYSNAKVNNTEFASGAINADHQVVVVNMTLENGQAVSKKIMMN
ncbi:T9SS sorting signal type C domain-containing protein [Flavobacterium sp. RNTU_13]|uniref:T9SS sorting signal type C domain-containing protein n=1 Tax=Flavobacterium sp. RNTU_13 TaxID=3375145 RepID=UPI00398758D6